MPGIKDHGSIRVHDAGQRMHMTQRTGMRRWSAQRGKDRMVADVLREIVTESDNRTHNIHKHLALISVAVGLSLQVYVVVKGQPFDIQTFGIGVGALLAGAGAALRLTPEASAPERTVA